MPNRAFAAGSPKRSSRPWRGPSQLNARTLGRVTEAAETENGGLSLAKASDPRRAEPSHLLRTFGVAKASLVHGPAHAELAAWHRRCERL